MSHTNAVATATSNENEQYPEFKRCLSGVVNSNTLSTIKMISELQHVP